MNSNFLPPSSSDSRHLASRWAKIFATIVSAALLAYPASAQFHVKPMEPVAPPPPVIAPVPVPMQTEQPEALPLPLQAQDWPTQPSAELIALRGSSSPAEKKLSFNLFLLTRKARKAPLGAFASLLNTSQVNPDGTITVNIAAYLSPSLMASPVMASILRVNGAISVPAYESDHLRAKVYQWQLLDLAANPNVLSITDFSAGKPVSAMASAGASPAIPAAR